MTKSGVSLMETDFTRFKAMMQDFGVGFKERTQDENPVIVFEQGSEKVGGYIGFVTEFHFNPDGDFVQVEVWE